jgi:hypothetical protein
MSLHVFVGLLSVGAIVGFILFAFRQGLRVKPENREDRGPSVGYPGDFTGDGGPSP